MNYKFTASGALLAYLSRPLKLNVVVESFVREVHATYATELNVINEPIISECKPELNVVAEPFSVKELSIKDAKYYVL